MVTGKALRSKELWYRDCEVDIQPVIVISAQMIPRSIGKQHCQLLIDHKMIDEIAAKRSQSCLALEGA